MNLQDFFNWIGSNPKIVLFYFLCIPIFASLIGFLANEKASSAPSLYLYSSLIYLVSIPGIFAMTLNIYLFLFERKSVFDANVYLQILPIFSMIATLIIIRNKVDLNLVPGFDRISGLITMITCAICFMWFLDRTHIYVFSYMPFWQVAAILIGLILIMRVGWKNFVTK
jgi:hypothetical protein